MATIEVIPVLVIFLVLINFTLGFFGLIHSGILNSIAARNYSFETFRNRADLNYIRDKGVPTDDMVKAHFNKVGFRYHGVIAEGVGSATDFVATERTIRFTDLNTGVENPNNDPNAHNRMVAQINDNDKVSKVFTGETADDSNSGVSPAWIKTMYGICLNSLCKK